MKEIEMRIAHLGRGIQNGVGNKKKKGKGIYQ
jgi:hypothetical protein